jgi:hypothetical protein
VRHGCETWSLILREEHRPGVFEKMVLRRIFGPQMVERVEGWRNEELHNLYFSPNIIRMVRLEDEMGRACNTNGG